MQTEALSNHRAKQEGGRGATRPAEVRSHLGGYHRAGRVHHIQSAWSLECHYSVCDFSMDALGRGGVCVCVCTVVWEESGHVELTRLVTVLSFVSSQRLKGLFHPSAGSTGSEPSLTGFCTALIFPTFHSPLLLATRNRLRPLPVFGHFSPFRPNDPEFIQTQSLSFCLAHSPLKSHLER